LKPQGDQESIIALFEEIRATFPSLRMDLQKEHPHVALFMDVRKQAGLSFDVNLNLQDDELHLSAGSFWLEWFPCTDPEITARYREAVIGIVSGQYRILEHCVGKYVVRADLQRPDNQGWQTIGTSSTGLGALIPWWRTTRVLQNR
jgi:hypothetical protein